MKAGTVDLNDPAKTHRIAEGERRGRRDGLCGAGRQRPSMGIQCALCHSTVDDSFAPGIGRRLDGWPNRDLNVGAIVALAPNLKPFTDLLGVDEADRQEGARRVGARASTTPSWTKTARRSVPTADRRDGASRGFRAGGRQPPHVHRMGLGDLLERVRREHADARQGDVLRSAARRTGRSSRSSAKHRFRQHSQRRRI